MVAVFGPRGCFIAGGFERSPDFELLEAPGLALRFSSMLPLLFLDRIKISKKLKRWRFIPNHIIMWFNNHKLN